MWITNLILLLGLIYPPGFEPGYTQQGPITWYGQPYHGNQTSCGETYDMNQMTLASNTLPCGTWVKVTNLENGQWALAEVTDSGPFECSEVTGKWIHHRRRIADASRALAKRLGMIRKGEVRVRIEIVPKPETKRERYLLRRGESLQSINEGENS